MTDAGMTDEGLIMDAVPYIVGWTTSELDLRADLAAHLPQAQVQRRMSGDRLVVRLRPDLAGRLAALTEVASVVRDELRQPDRPVGPRARS
ncbi:MAG: hypothetical protein U0R72_11550 [Nakamurella multipartita]